MELKPCPFCGKKQLLHNWELGGEGRITCPCGASMAVRTIREHYERIYGDLYRKIPSVEGREAVVEAWNRRANDV